MILNTELEYKGNLFPSKIVKYEKNLNVLSFTAENGVILEVTVRRDSILRFRFTTTGIFETISLMLLQNTLVAVTTT